MTASGKQHRESSGLPRLNLVTPEQPSEHTLETLDAVLAEAPAFVQVRTKGVDDRARLSFAVAALEVCRRYGAPCVINDRIDIALAAGADGVHLGDEDLPPPVARTLLGPDAIIGSTCRTPEKAVAAQADGADYLGVGPCFLSTTKPGAAATHLGPDGLASVVAAVDLPIVAISGITADNAGELAAVGAHGIAVVAAVFGAPDPVAAAKALLEATGETP